MRDDNKDNYIAWLEDETRDMRKTIQTLHEALSVFVKRYEAFFETEDATEKACQIMNRDK